jgi:hypothetical protein
VPPPWLACPSSPKSSAGSAALPAASTAIGRDDRSSADRSSANSAVVWSFKMSSPARSLTPSSMETRTSGAIDDCKTNVRVGLFRANFKKCFVSYQDPTSVVPKRASGTRALAPAALFPSQFGFGQRSAAQPARRTLPLQHSIKPSLAAALGGTAEAVPFVRSPATFSAELVPFVLHFSTSNLVSQSAFSTSSSNKINAKTSTNQLIWTALS